MFDPYGLAIRVIESPELVTPDLFAMKAICSTFNAKCPNCAKKALLKGAAYRANTKQLEGAYSKYVVKDVVNYEPTEVTLLAQKHRCYSCKKIFVDPNSPYKGTSLYTKDFEEFVASVFLSNIFLTIESLMETFDSPESAIRGAIKNYRVRYEEICKKLPRPPCSKVWLIDFDYLHNARLLVVGEHQITSQPILLGICSERKFKAAKNEFALNDPLNPIGEIIVENEKLKLEAAQEGCTVTFNRTSAFPFEFVFNIQSRIEILEAQRFAFDTMKLRIEMTEERKREEMRRHGIGRFLWPQERCVFDKYNDDDY